MTTTPSEATFPTQTFELDDDRLNPPQTPPATDELRAWLGDDDALPEAVGEVLLSYVPKADILDGDHYATDLPCGGYLLEQLVVRRHLTDLGFYYLTCDCGSEVEHVLALVLTGPDARTIRPIRILTYKASERAIETVRRLVSGAADIELSEVRVLDGEPALLEVTRLT